MINYGIFAIGIIVIFTALFIFRKDTGQDSNVDIEKVKEEQRKLIECIEIGEELIQEINQVGIHMIEEIDKKRQDIGDLLQKCEDRSLSFMDKSTVPQALRKEVNEIEKDVINQRVEPVETLPLNVVPEEALSEKILNLRAAGYTISQIAKELDKGIGEVQLILQLKKR